MFFRRWILQGTKTQYSEYGAVQSANTPKPGGERIVTYTPTHYMTWIVVKAGS